MPVADRTSAQAVQAQLDRIFASSEFATSERLQRFLTFVIERTLSGHHQDIKESVIAFEVYGRNENYDPKSDATVRVEASRLRSKLRK